MERGGAGGSGTQPEAASPHTTSQPVGCRPHKDKKSSTLPRKEASGPMARGDAEPSTRVDIPSVSPQAGLNWLSAAHSPTPSHTPELLHTDTTDIHKYTHRGTHMSVHTGTHTLPHIPTYLHTHSRTYAHIYTQAHTHAYTGTHIPAHTVHTRIHRHIPAHTQCTLMHTSALRGLPHTAHTAPSPAAPRVPQA